MLVIEKDGALATMKSELQRRVCELNKEKGRNGK